MTVDPNNPVAIALLVDQLTALWLRSGELRQARVPVTRAVDLTRLPPSRLEGVRDALSGVEYAAWIAGDTIAHLGGRDLLQRIYDAFGDANGTRASSWLDHRWNGVGNGMWIS